jgi:hypothetical protein
LTSHHLSTRLWKISSLLKEGNTWDELEKKTPVGAESKEDPDTSFIFGKETTSCMPEANFTEAAKENNVYNLIIYNLIIIHDKRFAERYAKHWQDHAPKGRQGRLGCRGVRDSKLF